MFNQISRRLVAGALGIACAVAVSSASAIDPIKYRQSVMKVVGGHMGAMAQILGEESSQKDHLLAHAQGMETAIGMIKTAFKDKTSGGETTALDKIWTDWAEFEAKADDAAKAASALVSAVQNNGDAGAARKDLGSTCGGCHKMFRVKKN